MLLVAAMILGLGIGAFSRDYPPDMEISSAQEADATVPAQDRRHPGKTGDEALLYDYLAGNLMHLTECEETFNFLYDGMLVNFPSSDVPYRPEQIAVLMLGVIPRTWAEVAYDRPIPAEVIGYVYGPFVEAASPPGWFGRILQALAGDISPLYALPESGHVINNGYITAGGTTGGRYTVTIEGTTLPAFCVNRDVPGPATGASHRFMPLIHEQILRALYFGWDGPGNIFGSGQRNEGVLATTVVVSHLNSGTVHPATHSLQGSRDLWTRVENTAEFPMQHNIQGVFIDVLAAGSQNLVALRVLPDEPPPPPPPPPPPERGNLHIVKRSESGIVSGIQFRIAGPDGFDQTVITSTDGTITVPDLQPGTYTVTELNLGLQYAPQPPQTVTVVENQTATVTFNNTLRPGNLRIVKTSESGVIAGIQFRITGQGINQSVTTEADGSITIPNLRPGTYVVTELNLGSQYTQQPSQTVTVRPNETTTVTFHNRFLHGSVSGLKVGEDMGVFQDAGGLAGAVIGIFPAGTTVFSEDAALQVVISGAGGVFSFRDLPYGDYLIRELSSGSAAYLLNEEVFPVRISSDGQVVQIRVENQLLRGRIEGHKVGETTTGMLAGIFEDADGLAGVTISIFAPEVEDFSTETALELAITDEYGGFVFEVPYGYYLIRELSTGNDAYVLSEETIPVRIDTDGQVIEIRLENRLAVGRIQGTKIGETTYGLLAGLFTDREGLGGATIGLFGLAELGIAQPEDDMDEDHDELPEDELLPKSETEEGDVSDDAQDDLDENEPDDPEKVILSIAGVLLEEFAFTTENAVQTAITAEDGSFTFEEVIVGHWVVREVYAPEAYTLNENLFVVAISEDGQAAIVGEVPNTLIRGDIEGLKVGQDTEYPFEGMFTDGEGLAGAVIGLFREEAETFAEADAVQVAISSEEGHFIFRDVIFGNWIVREIATGNPAYTLNTTSFPITISEEGQVIELVIENELIFGDLRGYKVNAADANEGLAGADFGLFHEGATELGREDALLTVTSAADGSFSIEDIPWGTFQLVELSAPEGFLLSDEVFTIEITEAGQVIELRIENEPEEEDTPEKGTPDQPNRPNQPPRAPQTGDDTSLPWFTLVLSLFGMVAIIVGAVWYKRRCAGKSDAE